MSNEGLEKEAFPLGKPLTSRYKKRFVEQFALEILWYYYGNLYNECEVKGAPDIQNKSKSMGIEVTEAVLNEDAQISNELTKYRLENEPTQKERRKRIIEDNSGEIDDFILSYPEINNNLEKQILQNTLREKMEKFISYKEQGFEKIGMFIYYSEIPIPVHGNKLKEYFDQVLNEYDNKYDVIYYGFPYTLVEYDILQNEILSKPIDRNVYNRLQCEAKLKVQA